MLNHAKDRLVDLALRDFVDVLCGVAFGALDESQPHVVKAKPG